MKTEHDPKAWKGRIYCECGMVGLNWLAILLYFIIFGLGMQVDNDDVYNDLSVYYQAAEDWDSLAWVDFKWGSSTDAD